MSPVVLRGQCDRRTQTRQS